MICSEYSTFCQPCWHFRRIRSARVATPAPVPVSPGRHPDDETPRAYIWRTGNVRCGQESKSPVAFLRACGRIPGVLRGLLDLRKFIGLDTEVHGLPPEVHRTSGPTGQKSMDFWIPETLFLAPESRHQNLAADHHHRCYIAVLLSISEFVIKTLLLLMDIMGTWMVVPQRAPPSNHHCMMKLLMSNGGRRYFSSTYDYCWQHQQCLRSADVVITNCCV